MNIDKLNKIIEIINDIKKEEADKQIKIKEQLLDKLENKENNWFLVIKNEYHEPYKIYSTRATDYNSAYNSFENLIEEVTNGEYALFNKEEVSTIIHSITNNEVWELKDEGKK